MNSRRRIVAGSIAATLSLSALAACGDDANGSSDGTQEIQLMMFPGVAYRLPVLIAEQEGYFKDAGISIKEIAQPGNIPGIQGLVSTRSDVGQFAVATTAQAKQAGEDVKFFCGLLPEVQSSIVANADSDLPSVDDGATWEDVLKALDGSKFGVQVPVGAGFQLLTAAAFSEVGVKDLTYINVGGSNTTTGPALDNGDVEAAIASPPGTQFLTADGKHKVLAYLPDGPNAYNEWYGSGWGATTAWIDENPELAEGFCSAVQKGIDYVKDPANKDDVKQVLMKDTGIPENIADLVLPTYDVYSTALPKETFDATLEGYVDAGIVTDEPAVTYDTLVDDKSGK